MSRKPSVPASVHALRKAQGIPEAVYGFPGSSSLRDWAGHHEATAQRQREADRAATAQLIRGIAAAGLIVAGLCCWLAVLVQVGIVPAAAP